MPHLRSRLILSGTEETPNLAGYTEAAGRSRATVPARPARRWWWMLRGSLSLALAATGLWLVRAPLLSAVSGFLVVEDELQPAAAIIVLDGGIPFREQEAARLYQSGWAPRIVITRGPDTRLSRAQILEQHGVPGRAIDVIDRLPTSTLEELEVLAGAIGQADAPVVLVTSSYHTRRAGLAWRRAADGRTPGIVRAAWQEHGLETWWRTPDMRLRVWHEYLGLVAYVLGQ